MATVTPLDQKTSHHREHRGHRECTEGRTEEKYKEKQQPTTFFSLFFPLCVFSVLSVSLW
jgi:hypothetical protein